jgi:putative hemolysin
MSASGRTTVRTRLKNASSELDELERLLSQNKHEIDARVLQEFRQAVKHLHETVATVRQWIDLRTRKGDPFSVLAALSAERVRAGAEICKNVVIDLDSGDVAIQTPGVDELARTVRDLSERLDRVVKTP